MSYRFGELQTVSLRNVLSALERNGIEHVYEGHAHQSDTFHPASLRAPVSRGFYFSIGNHPIPEGFGEALLLVKPQGESAAGGYRIQVEDPQLAYYLVLADLFASPVEPGVHPSAVISADAQIDPSAWIGPHCVVEAVEIGAGSQLHSSVTVMEGTRIGCRVRVEGSTVIGATGAAWAWNPRERTRVMQPQIGFTDICDDTFVGSNVTIVRGSVSEATLIGRGVIMAHGTKIGHGSTIGEECHFANNVSIAGNVDLGARCFVGSGAVVRPNIRIDARTVIGAGAVVVRDTTQEGGILSGVPAKSRESTTKRLSGVPDISSM